MSDLIVDQALLNEVLDTEKVTLICEKHNYVAGSGSRRTMGCAKCIMVDYVYMFAKTPPDKRKEALDQFEALIQTMCELEDEGKLDIHIYPHPEVVIERDVN